MAIKKYKGGTLKTIVFPDGHRMVIRLSRRTIPGCVCSSCQPRNKMKPYCERKHTYTHMKGEDYSCHHVCGSYHYPIVIYDGNKKL